MTRFPVSGDAVSQAMFAGALLDPERACPDGLRAFNGSDPARRLAVHRNTVVSSLIDALADSFPVVQQLVGEAFFRAVAGTFVRQHPPRSPILALYGDQLPDFLVHFGPARSLPYLADVARLEFARVLACHAADAEPVDDQQVSLALASGARIGELKLVCHRSVSTLDSRYAVVSLWAAHQGEGEINPVVINRPESAIVVRDAFDVLVLRAAPGAVVFVDAIGQGVNLGDAASAATQREPAFDLAATLSLLLTHRALTSLELP